MQKQGRRQQPGGHVAEINHLIEAVELPRVVKTEINERRQAKNIEMPGFLRAAAAEINEQADNQIRETHQVLVDHGPVERYLTHDQVVDGNLDAAAYHHIGGVAPDAEAGQNLGDVYGLADMDTVDGGEPIAGVDSGAPAGTGGGHFQRLDTARPVHPDDAILGKTEMILLVKIDAGGHRGGKRKYGEDRRG